MASHFEDHGVRHLGPLQPFRKVDEVVRRPGATGSQSKSHGGYFAKRRVQARLVRIRVGRLVERALKPCVVLQLNHVERACFPEGVGFKLLKVGVLSRCPACKCSAIQIVRIQKESIEGNRLRVVHRARLDEGHLNLGLATARIPVESWRKPTSLVVLGGRGVVIIGACSPVDGHKGHNGVERNPLGVKHVFVEKHGSFAHGIRPTLVVVVIVVIVVDISCIHERGLVKIQRRLVDVHDGLGMGLAHHECKQSKEKNDTISHDNKVDSSSILGVLTQKKRPKPPFLMLIVNQSRHVALAEEEGSFDGCVLVAV